MKYGVTLGGRIVLQPSYDFIDDGKGTRSGGQASACEDCQRPFKPGDTIHVWYRSDLPRTLTTPPQHWKCDGCHAQAQAALRDAKRAARYDELKHLPKAELLALLGQKMRIHAMTERDSKGDIIRAILSAEIPEPRTRSR